MLLEIIKAIFIAGIPVALVSYYLIILTNDVKVKDTKNIVKKDDSLKKDKPENGKVVKQMVHKKYLKFGGGFYGVVAFITYIHVEIYQVIDFVKKFTSIQDFIDRIGFSMIINFFIEAIMNFVAAITWPIYWHKYLPIGSIVIWIVVAIVAHTLGTKHAFRKNKID